MVQVDPELVEEVQHEDAQRVRGQAPGAGPDEWRSAVAHALIETPALGKVIVSGYTRKGHLDEEEAPLEQTVLSDGSVGLLQKDQGRQRTHLVDGDIHADVVDVTLGQLDPRVDELNVSYLEAD